ncbi:helix-turn-helix domain-containing protein [Rhodococcus sp. BP-252]|uniref:MerR family transcriptional regulator n=1 Tax=Rhodococcoides kyotonense TaxID=398843 RepID=A0A177YKG0_9NOCA|nr:MULTISPECIES: helix-turn-helix domain-containing protein [Rhodococcus]MBY6413297.1 helix-turn-helix domain-containing protein [Rhodococcus sp. BP-320]MBY6419279.1 helix-turn-helix domain-containing protein [Rhodococcus sp. BP-321]MBY6424300.1 helix-turn-helix domain-containing protein [Rhodococcus sp. BP-324]MBY6428040.1 helix-turn-helix domain-containing protein [Rhodococcus sp. BP-323]MBY6433218.1 helix-turn-helix domain-containing protein [Rhodococcus sp. BP-322]
MDHRYIASALSAEDSRAVDAVVAGLDGRTPDIAVDGVSLDIDEPARRAVVELLRQLASGTAVTVGPVGELLTTSQAAEILGVSDTYVRRLADAGDLAIEMRGTHRRFKLEDLVRLREKFKRDR